MSLAHSKTTVKYTTKPGTN